MDSDNQDEVWCIMFWLDTTGWRKKDLAIADLPWCLLYTKNQRFVDEIPEEASIPLANGKEQKLTVAKHRTLMPTDDVDPDTAYVMEMLGDFGAAYEAEKASRSLGFLSSNTATIKKRVLDRLLQWQN